MTDQETLDLLDEVLVNQEQAARVLSELINRMTRMETRLVVLVNALGHADKIHPTKGTV